MKSNFASIKGLDEALKAPESGVSSIYALNSVEKAWTDIQAFKGGKAVSNLSLPQSAHCKPG